jgi:hypothetical protein
MIVSTLTSVVAGDRSSLAAKRNMFEQQSAPPRPPPLKKAAAAPVGIPPRSSGQPNGNGLQSSSQVSTPARKPAPPSYNSSNPPAHLAGGLQSSSSAPARPPNSGLPKRSPSAPNIPQQAIKKATPPGPPVPTGSGSVPTPPSAPKPVPKKLQPNMIPAGLVVNKGPSNAAALSTSPSYGTTPPINGPSSAPIPPPNPFASARPVAPIATNTVTTPPLSPTTTPRSQPSPVSPSVDTEKKESFFNQLFGKKKPKESKHLSSLFSPLLSSPLPSSLSSP